MRCVIQYFNWQRLFLYKYRIRDAAYCYSVLHTVVCLSDFRHSVTSYEITSTSYTSYDLSIRLPHYSLSTIVFRCLGSDDGGDFRRLGGGIGVQLPPGFLPHYLRQT